MDAIEVRNVSKKFRERGKDFYALKNVTLSVENEEIFGLMGPNGAGKTTLINILINMLEPDNGYVRIFGKPPGDVNTMESMSLVIPHLRYHWSLTAENVFSVFSKIYNIPKNEAEKRAEKLVRFFSLEDVAKRKTWYLSTGELMRLNLAKALLSRPKILLLDEPTLGLDPEIAARMREEILRINRKYGTTILLTSHYMNEVELLADRIAFIKKGEIIESGTIEKVKSKHFPDYEIIVKVKSVTNAKALRKQGFRIKGRTISRSIRVGDDVSGIISFLKRSGMTVTDIETVKPDLEDYFVKVAGGKR